MGFFISYLDQFLLIHLSNRISDCKTVNMGAAAASKPVADMLAASLPATDVLTVISGLVYHISRLVFTFPLIKIVFLIVKLVTQG